MAKRTLIIGGYGNFGSFIANKLAPDSNIQLIIAGRNEEKAKELASNLKAANKAEYAVLDINKNLSGSLTKIKPDIVIHTSGPYQGQGYHVAKLCIKQGCHYIDLADARDFVSGISQLDKKAKEKAVFICSGASSVPCLTSAIIDHYKPHFKKLEKIDYAISTAQLTNRGLATTSAALSYAGKPFKTLIDGKMQDVHGWTDLKCHKFWKLGSRLLGRADTPDLELFPKRYPDLKTINFYGGLEIKLLQFLLFLSSWLVRIKLMPTLLPFAKIMLKSSFIFDSIGTGNSGFYMQLFGKCNKDVEKELAFEIVAKDGDGAFIPTMPAIIIARKLASNKIRKKGATPCIGIITLDEYLKEFDGLNIKWHDKVN